MKIRPIIVDKTIVSPTAIEIITRDKNGAKYTKFATCAVVFDNFNAFSHNRKVIPISNNPI
jgi:hypothetical protein